MIEFSEAVGIEHSTATEIAQKFSKVRLCAVHSGYMKRALEKARAQLKRCSIFCVLPDGASGSNVTQFCWEETARNE